MASTTNATADYAALNGLIQMISTMSEYAKDGAAGDSRGMPDRRTKTIKRLRKAVFEAGGKDASMSGNEVNLMEPRKSSIAYN